MGLFGNKIRDKKDAFLLILKDDVSKKDLEACKEFVNKKYKQKISYIERYDYELIDYLYILKTMDENTKLIDINTKTRKILLYQMDLYVLGEPSGEYLPSVMESSVKYISVLYNKCRKINSYFSSTMATVLGYCYVYGWGVEKNLDKSKEYLELANKIFPIESLTYLDNLIKSKE